mgnify:CR=1 FL=1
MIINMLIEILFILISRLLYTFYGYEGVNLLFKVSPSRCIVAVLKHYGAKIGENTRIQAPFGIHNADNNIPIFINLDIGKDCYVGRNIVMDLTDEVTIGNRVKVGHGTYFNTHTNIGKCKVNTEKLSTSKNKIIVEDDVYIGINVSILEGVSIGSKSIIGACSLINKNINPDSIAYGVPVKEVND